MVPHQTSEPANKKKLAAHFYSARGCRLDSVSCAKSLFASGEDAAMSGMLAYQMGAYGP